LWPNGWMDQHATWYGCRPPPRRHCLRYGEPAASPAKMAQPLSQFSTHVYCGQMAGWIKVLLGTEVGLDPGNVVVDGDPAPPKSGTALPVFGPCLLWPKGWMDEDATWYGSRSRPRPRYVKRRLSSPPRKGHSIPPSLAHVYCGQTVVHLCTAELLLRNFGSM